MMQNEWLIALNFDMWGKWRNVTSLYSMLQQSGFLKPLMWEKMDYGTFHMFKLQLKGNRQSWFNNVGPTVICGANSIIFNITVLQLHLPGICWLKLHVMAMWSLAEQWPSPLQLSFKGCRALQLNNRLKSMTSVIKIKILLWLCDSFHNDHQDSRQINLFFRLPKRSLNY